MSVPMDSIWTDSQKWEIRSPLGGTLHSVPEGIDTLHGERERERERLCVCVCVMNPKIKLEGSARQAREGGRWRGNVVQSPWSVSPASWKLQIGKASREAGKEPSSPATQGPSRHVRPKSTEASYCYLNMVFLVPFTCSVLSPLLQAG